MGVGQPLIEARPEMVQIVAHLEAHGALRDPGYRVMQQVFADELGLNVRRLRVYLAALETHRLLVVRRTTVDGSFGSPRGPNIYRLKCSTAQYEQLAPELVKLREEKVAKRRSAKARNRENEKRRSRGKSPIGPPVVSIPQKPAPGVLEPAEVERLAARYDSDDDLAGW